MQAIFDQGVAAPCPRPFNMAAHVLRHADDLPEKVALSVIALTGAESWTYARLAAAVRGTGAGLLAAGFVPGDILLMRLGNTVDFPLAYLGAIAAGLVPVPTSSQLTAAEVAKMVAQLAPKGILRDPRVACPDDTGLPVIDTAALAGMRDLPPCDYAMGDPDRLGYIIYTSGTSGIPRAVMHAHRAIWARQMMHQGWYGLGGDDRLLHAGAFNWTYTLGTGLMDPWASGNTALIPGAGVTPAQLPLLLKRFDVTIFAAAPGVYRQMLRAPLAPMPHLRHGLSAGEKLPEQTREAWTQATGTPIYEALGMSEVSTYISASPLHPTSAGASGYPQRGRKVAVLGEDGQPVPRGEAGVMAVGRDDPGLFLGYWGQEAETAAKFRGEWFLTGDTVSMDEDGAIRYLGRDDDMMNAGGFRVSPLEVEKAMNAHPGIVESAAIEARVSDTTTILALYYVPAADAPDAASLAAHAEAHLARYKQPRQFIAVEALPKGANNKINRRALRQGYETP